MTHRPVAILAFVSATLVSLRAFPVSAEGREHHGHTLSIDDDAAGCAAIHTRFHGLEVATSEEQITVRQPRGPFRIDAAPNGGVRVVPGEGNEYEVTACKAAGGSDTAAAHAALASVALALDGDHLTVKGPRGDDWVAFLVVKAPRGAALDVETTNGPLSANGVSGTLHLMSVNGPLSIAGFSGELKATATNGPVSLSGSSGDVSIDATNGPLSVRLAGTRWDGRGLTARTENGPVTLHLPDGYASGVEVKASGHSPVRCRVAACGDSRKDADDETRHLTFGSGEPVVRLSTGNGPVSVQGTTEVSSRER